MTAGHFVRVADTVAVRVVQHHSVALANLASVVGEDTRTVVLQSNLTVVARIDIGATNEVAYTITVCVLNAIAITVEWVVRIIHWILAASVVIRSSVVVVASVVPSSRIQRGVCAAIARLQITRTVVERRAHLVVTRQVVGAPVTRDEVT